MKHEYEVFMDKTKGLISIIVYAMFAIGIVAIICTSEVHIVMLIVMIMLIALFIMALVVKIKKMSMSGVLYKFDESGIWDYTKKEDTLFLSWDEIFKIEMIPNNTSLQIGILAKKTIEVKENMSRQMKENLLENGNLAFYSILIDGFDFRKKKFFEIFKELKEFAEFKNKDILMVEYEDPILKKKKKKKYVG